MHKCFPSLSPAGGDNELSRWMPPVLKQRQEEDEEKRPGSFPSGCKQSAVSTAAFTRLPNTKIFYKRVSTSGFQTRRMD
ncbi:hypothetical protein OJAV_G00035380 [Oryzias javanicus]|uniref:Uncharacterized protein n=1 Tax=Oryzias javanicus TaxID=123683 RepID=A0A3S2PZ26_ORYJA|nr:hypothetical protein OJAV_G00035380 [Oryzias javanicus]